MRARQLSKHPLCDMCRQQGRITPATVADHIVPHHGDPRLFYDPNNLQSLCASCHNARKKLQEIHGYSPACGIDGQPLDANHPWLKGKKK
jgi:5-methylcytosine-specific restriction enzyme A